MNQRPILFSTDMVNAILYGRKTMTRRKVEGEALKFLRSNFSPQFVAENTNLCKYGKVGDLLWVRETWQHTSNFGINPLDETTGYIFKASENGKDWQEKTEGWKWKSSLFMPKDAARIWLEITGIRVERLKDITEKDAIAEGIEKLSMQVLNKPLYMDYMGDEPKYNPIDSFKSLWQSINSYESWEENPFVWVIEFKHIKKP